MRRIITKTVAGLIATFALQANALQIISLSPQGEVARVRQIVVKFDDSAVNFGDPKAPAPPTLSCSDAQASKGNGRWISDREWAFEFENDLPPGVNCSLQVRLGMKLPSSPAVTGTSSYKFNSGGPVVTSLCPGSYERIDEEQYVLPQLNRSATPQSVQENKVNGVLQSTIQYHL
ncbi:MAG: hypothetical protein H7228_07100 [Polaromonas sp.]|nr:hypothetical protein [Polaromonas sp.]